MKQEILFHNPEDLARFMAEIIRQGLTYQVDHGFDDGKQYWLITLTGGF